MKLDPNPNLVEGPNLFFTLVSLFRKIAQAVNGKAEQTEIDALRERIEALENS